MANFNAGDKIVLKDQSKSNSRWEGPMDFDRYEVGDKVRIHADQPWDFIKSAEGRVTTVVGVGARGVTLEVANWKNGWGPEQNQCWLENKYVSRHYEKVNPRASRASHPVNQTALRHLKNRKTISPMEALATYGIMRLAPAIHDLRAAGYNIKTEIRQDAKGHRYARYELAA